MVHVTLAEELIGNAAQKPQQKEEKAWKGNNKSVVRKSEGQVGITKLVSGDLIWKSRRSKSK